MKPSKWWSESFGVVQTNLREIDADMDVDAVADWIKEFGATAWLCGVGGIQAQYPTSLAFQSQNSNLARRSSGDLVGDAIKAAHARGLKFLARMDFSKVSPEVAAEHPEWCYMSPTGHFQEHTASLVSVCPSGDYYQHRIYEILEEITTLYKIDGLFFNWATMNEEDYFKHYHGVCHCDSCQSRWFAFSDGLELPNGPEDANYGLWLHFSREVIDGVTSKIRAFMAAKLPEAAIIRTKLADIVYQESNNEIGRDFWHHTVSEWVSSWISFRPKVPVLSNSTCFIDMRYRMAGEEPAQFAQYLLQSISRGGTPSTYMMGVPGKIPYPCLDHARDITQFHKKWSDIYTGMAPVALTGLVRPDRAFMEKKEYANALAEFRGLYNALQESQIPFDVVAMEHLPETNANGSLDRYKNLVLPSLGQLRDGSAEIFDDWVQRQGGNLIATGSTGQGVSGNIQLESLPVHRRRAAVTEGKFLWSSYVAPPQKTKNIHYYVGPIIPIHGCAYYFDWKPESRTFYRVLARAPFAPPEKAYGNLQNDQPGCGVARYGSGQGALIPFTVGKAYRETGLTCLRDFFLDVFSQIATPEPISFNLAEQVEVTVNQTAGKLVVHLINMSGARKLNFGTHLPISGGSITVTGGGKVRARALRANTELKTVGGVIQLPELDLFEVVIIEGMQNDHLVGGSSMKDGEGRNDAIFPNGNHHHEFKDDLRSVSANEPENGLRNGNEDGGQNGDPNGTTLPVPSRCSEGVTMIHNPTP
ncbi:hypothetical protein BU24DRAFT_348503 [Aaosphaeria arxii CBS 175.79]|uniref:Uncharacterized protein n=1 Tax=Aaosphaeria arxii CBS 175.79 TaxID=1450172 RepID=A0A6A5XMU8_9PLEO|nr:uncharacterized protein BU24DRAFT_348503 [Aaosphaeria arxii CBS 175.79]KAF2014442.1 hypothetical protein BU24DRAFT_348503 [Aaosphaeria arxii CBS 175.79]